MATIILTSVVALAMAYFVLRSHSTDSSQLTEPRSTVVTLGVQIICGNCAGEEGPPSKTYLDRFSNCAQCGGDSYILAANRMMHSQWLSR